MENTNPRAGVGSDNISLCFRLLFLVPVSVVFFAATGFQSYALPQGKTKSTSLELTAFDNLVHQFQDGWRHRTDLEQKKAAVTLIAEADKLPDSDPRKARALMMAAAVYIHDIPLDIALTRRVVAIDEKNLGGSDPQVASDLGNLALLSALRGDIIEAERSYGRAVKIAEGAEQMGSFERSTIFTGAAEFYKRQKRYDEAEALLRRAVEVADGLPSAYATSHRLQFRASLAEVLRVDGKEYEAERLMAEPPPASKTAQADPDSMNAENDSLRARQYKDQGKMGEAEVFYKHAISAFEKSPAAAFLLAQDLDELADIYHSEGRDVEAEQLYRRALDLREKSLTPETARNARVMGSVIMGSPDALQNFLRDQGRLSEIEPVYEQTLRIQEQYLGPNDYSLGQTLENLARVYREEGKSEAALPLCQRALKIAEHNFGEDDPQVAWILNEYAQNLQKLGRTRDATAMHARAERITNRKPPLK